MMLNVSLGNDLLFFFKGSDGASVSYRSVSLDHQKGLLNL